MAIQEITRTTKKTNRFGRLVRLGALLLVVVTSCSQSQRQAPTHRFAGEWESEDGPDTIIIDQLGFVTFMTKARDPDAISSQQPFRLDSSSKGFQVEIDVHNDENPSESVRVLLRGRLVTDNKLLLEVSGESEGSVHKEYMTLVRVE